MPHNANGEFCNCFQPRESVAAGFYERSVTIKCGCEHITPPEPDCVPGLLFTKDCDPVDNYEVGDEVMFTFTIENTGDCDLFDVTVTDPTATVVGAPFDLPAGETNTDAYTATYTLVEADGTAGQFTNEATVVASIESGSGVADIELTDDHTVTLVEAPDCTVCHMDLRGSGVRVDWAGIGFDPAVFDVGTAQTFPNVMGLGVDMTVTPVGNNSSTTVQGTNATDGYIRFDSPNTETDVGWEITFSDTVCLFGSVSRQLGDLWTWSSTDGTVFVSTRADSPPVSGTTISIAGSPGGTVTSSASGYGEQNNAPRLVTSAMCLTDFRFVSELGGRINFGLYIDTSCNPSYVCEDEDGNFTDYETGDPIAEAGEWTVVDCSLVPVTCA